MSRRRYATQSPDHFTCRCGRWCLDSPCPTCEPREREAYERALALQGSETSRYEKVAAGKP